MPSLPPVCAVVGGGRMGSGIAHALLLAGAEVRVLEVDDDSAAAARRRVERLVVESVRRGVILDDAHLLDRLSATSSAAELSGVGLVVEAVFEDAELKRDTLARVAAVVEPQTVIATNTSSIALRDLVPAVTHPERFVGMHFFNPVPSSRLIEVVRIDETSPAVVDRVVGWSEHLGKTPIVVTSAPGFATSRLGLVLGLEAIRMVEEGVAAPEDIDRAMELGYGHPMGPLRLTDLVGLDVRLGVARYLWGTLGERFRPPALLEAKVERGELGRKSGLGFYPWPADDRTGL